MTPPWEVRLKAWLIVQMPFPDSHDGYEVVELRVELDASGSALEESVHDYVITVLLFTAAVHGSEGEFSHLFKSLDCQSDHD